MHTYAYIAIMNHRHTYCKQTGCICELLIGWACFLWWFVLLHSHRFPINKHLDSSKTSVEAFSHGLGELSSCAACQVCAYECPLQVFVIVNVYYCKYFSCIFAWSFVFANISVYGYLCEFLRYKYVCSWIFLVVNIVFVNIV